MQVLSKTLLGRPVMSLRTGSRVATTVRPIINPNNLKIEGFYCQDSIDPKLELILVERDIREIIPAGIVVNDHDVLAEPEDLIRLKKILKIDFELFNKPVVSDKKRKLGKVSDFSTELPTLYIQKLYVSQPLIKTLTGGNIGVDRGQIIEITNRKIIVQDPLKLVRTAAPSPAIAN